jgi:hypothetical protein
MNFTYAVTNYIMLDLQGLEKGALELWYDDAMGDE